MVLFCVTFSVLIVLFAVLSSTAMARTELHEPLSRLIARVSATVLGVLDAASVAGATVGFRTFSVEIVEACNGVLPTMIFLAAVLAFPSSLSAKVCGIGLGIPVIFLLNVVRIISLALLGAWRPSLFDKVHIYVWQAVVIVASMALWVLWVEAFARRRSRGRP
jgi:exosortase H (IPTLxxWG-CTERM-specific)